MQKQKESFVSDQEYPERRRHERIRVSFFIDWGFDTDCGRQARITSLSLGGCFLQTPDEAQAGQSLYIRMSLPEEHLLAAEVRYHMPAVGFGIMFTNLTPQEQAALETLIEYYKQ
jgi:hypothetical protein